MVLFTMNAPIACQLGVFSDEERGRYASLRSLILGAVSQIVEIENGYVFHLPGDDAMLATVADWVALERRCCPFFEISVSIGGSDPRIRVALTGSPEVKSFLEAEFRWGVVTTRTIAVIRAARPGHSPRF